ncbi:hypothetical protein GGD65_006078 [Bradyrhizobium sp. CIR18]|uniref:hypothetical protein n=1 Tax=Bradyrhizobium sp. CIR18 TaxID=2663839 RepID=UPI0016067243|nr:hypothetical protein [Bradyrhizobium sp. CIR18]MBB4365014.1 hypothetical protein [Bradyrhizobium sp. CIR18]
MAVDGKQKGAFFKIQKMEFNKCLHGTFDCKKPAIRAHSIQNAKVLDVLQKDNHVLIPQGKIAGGATPVVEFELIGRNNASTFTGLCGEHDRELFKLIDTEPLDTENQDQMYELGHRALLREMHACLEAANRFQNAHYDNIKNGVTKLGEPDGPGVMAVNFWIKAWRVFRYQCEHFERKPELVHYVVELDDQIPTVAVSSFFSIDHDGNNIIGPLFNVVPVSDKKTVAVLSYPKAQEDPIKKALAKLFDEPDKKEALSVLILQRVENFVLSPTFYDSWTEEKKKNVIEFFNDSIEEPADPPPGQDLLLF